MSEDDATKRTPRGKRLETRKRDITSGARLSQGAQSMAFPFEVRTTGPTRPLSGWRVFEARCNHITTTSAIWRDG